MSIIDQVASPPVAPQVEQVPIAQYAAQQQQQQQATPAAPRVIAVPVDQYAADEKQQAPQVTAVPIDQYVAQNQPQRRFQDLTHDDAVLNAAYRTMKRYDPDDLPSVTDSNGMVDRKALADWYVNDRRWKDSNDISMGKELVRVNQLDPNSADDAQQAQDYRTLRQTWSELPSVFSKGGAGFGGAVSDVAKSIPSVSTAVGLASGGLAKGLGVLGAAGVDAGVNAAISGVLDAVNQKTNQGLGLQDGIDAGEVLKSAAFGAATSVPFALARGAQLTGGAAKLEAAAQKARQRVPDRPVVPSNDAAAVLNDAAVPSEAKPAGTVTAPIGEQDAGTILAQPKSLAERLNAQPGEVPDTEGLGGTRNSSDDPSRDFHSAVDPEAFQQAKQDLMDSISRQKGNIVPDEQVAGTVVARAAQDYDGLKQSVLSVTPRTPVNAEMVTAGQYVADREYTALQQLKQQIANTTDPKELADLTLQRMKQQDDFNKAFTVSQGINSEAGRALRAVQIDLSTTSGQLQTIQSAMSRFGGTKNVKLFNTLADSLTDVADPQIGKERVSIFTNIISKPSFGDKFLEAWYGSILSSPSSLLKNISGNTITGLLSIPETAVATGINAVRRGLGYAVDPMYSGEAAYRAIGMFKGIFNNASDALQTGLADARDFMSGQNVGGMQLHEGQIGGVAGKAVRLMPQLHGASDAFFRSVAAAGDLYQQAYRQARMEADMRGGPTFEQAFKDYILKTSAGDFDRMKNEAAYYTFQNKPNAITQGLQAFGEKVPALRVILPFMRTPSNIMDYAIERTPLASVLRGTTVWSTATGVDRDVQLGRMVLGSSAFGTAAYFAAQGRVTGSAPLDPKEKATWDAAGMKPYSVKIGNEWHSYDQFDPLGLVLSLGADAHMVYDKIGPGGWDKALGLTIQTMTHNFIDRSYMQGLNNIFQALQEPNRAGQYVVDSLAQNVIPNVVARYAAAQDDTARDIRSFYDSIINRVPDVGQGPQFSRKGLPMKRDGLFGKPIVNDDKQGLEAPFTGAAATVYSANLNGRTAPVNQDPAAAEAMRLGFNKGMPSRSIGGQQLTPQQYSDYLALKGDTFHRIMEQVIQAPGYPMMPKQMQTALWDKYYSLAEKSAQRNILIQDFVAGGTLKQDQLLAKAAKKGIGTEMTQPQ